MPADTFIDTNVFVYHLDRTDLRKHAVAETIVRGSLASGSGCISFQVMQECLNTALRKAEVKLGIQSARSYLDAVLTPLLRIHSSPTLLQRALDVHQRWQFGFYDALIVAAALEAGCRRIVTEDLQHGQRIEHLVVENPFLKRT
jgi:predicted nucleic acid-binding protein